MTKLPCGKVVRRRLFSRVGFDVRGLEKRAEEVG